MEEKVIHQVNGHSKWSGKQYKVWARPGECDQSTQSNRNNLQVTGENQYIAILTFIYTHSDSCLEKVTMDAKVS